jgi:hypothetical protein
VVNLSYGGAADCNAEYQGAIDELWARGTVVAAAGNAHGAHRRDRPTAVMWWAWPR